MYELTLRTYIEFMNNKFVSFLRELKDLTSEDYKPLLSFLSYSDVFNEVACDKTSEYYLKSSEFFELGFSRYLGNIRKGLKSAWISDSMADFVPAYKATRYKIEEVARYLMGEKFHMLGSIDDLFMETVMDVLHLGQAKLGELHATYKQKAFKASKKTHELLKIVRPMKELPVH